MPDGEAWAAALAVVLMQEKPFATLLAHSNVAIDLAPGLSVRTKTRRSSPTASPLEVRGDGELVAVRALYGGKLHGRFSAPVEASTACSLRFAAARSRPRSARRPERPRLRRSPSTRRIRRRRRYRDTVEPEPGEVDISQAQVLVGVGRGIEEEENLEIVQALAEALGGEVACSRPVVDKGWLPKSRQVGT